MNPSILTVDDSELNNLLISTYFKEEYNVTTALSGFEALSLLEKYTPDVILLDIMMPKMDGVEVLSRIMENQETKFIPVIMVSARTEMEDVQQSLKLGAFDYVKKPIDFTELQSKISIALQIKKKNEEILKYRTYFNIHESMLSAQRVQRSLLPDKKTFIETFPDSFILDLPKDIVSGDFYWLFSNGKMKALSLFDATGHGIPGAMISIIGHILLNEIVDHNNITRPNEVLTKLRNEINSNVNRSTDTFTVHNGMDGLFCTIDNTTNIMEFSSAKRPLIIIRENNGKLVVNNSEIEPDLQHENYSLFEIKKENISIDKQSTDKEFTNIQIQLAKGDAIYMYSDGITDQLGGSEIKTFKKKQLFDILIKNQNDKISNQKALIYKEINNWKKEIEQTDDILIIGIKI